MNIDYLVLGISAITLLVIIYFQVHDRVLEKSFFKIKILPESKINDFSCFMCGPGFFVSIKNKGKNDIDVNFRVLYNTKNGPRWSVGITKFHVLKFTRKVFKVMQPDDFNTLSEKHHKIIKLCFFNQYNSEVCFCGKKLQKWIDEAINCKNQLN